MTTHGVTRAYRRISLDTKASGSIVKQGERLSAAEVAAGRSASGIVWYDDEGVSGSRDVKRPQRDRLLMDIGPGDRVIVTKIDRLARNVSDLLAIVEHITARGASIRFIDQDISTEGPYGRFILTLLGAIAELEAGIIGERQRESRASFLANGRHPAGLLPIGFRTVPNPNGNGLVVALDPETAPMVRDAIMRVMAGESQNTVRESLNMSKTGFHSLVHNPRLAGMIPEGDGVYMINGVPRINKDAAILSMDEWRKLCEALGDSDKTWSHRNDGYGRAMFCSVCDDRLYVNLSKRDPNYSTYRCRKAKHEPGIGGASIIVNTANREIEATFLKRYGPYRQTLVTWTDEGSVRTEAISQALITVSELTRRMGEASSPDDLMKLSVDLVAAHTARANAEAMPIERVKQERETGLTIAEAWEKADHVEREEMILTVGRFRVRPGRLEVHHKISFVPHKKVETLTESFDRVRLGLLTDHKVK